MAIAAPAKDQPPVLFDVATSAVAGNKIGLAARVGSNLLPGWIADREGQPLMEETPVLPRGQYFQLPLGGTREQGSHKGYGMALMVEIFSTMLSGTLPFGLDRSTGYKHFFAAYNIAAFADVDEFKEHMDQMLEWLRETKAAPGEERVLYPGLLEYEEEQRAPGTRHPTPQRSHPVVWEDYQRAGCPAAGNDVNAGVSCQYKLAFPLTTDSCL